MKEDVIPEWLNVSFLTSVLKQKDEDIQVTSFATTPAVLGGNNYCSRMWRVNVTYKDGGGNIKSTSVMVKTCLPDGIFKEKIDEMKFVEKELMFYRDLVPKMYKISDEVEVVPKIFSSYIPETIVLEDLKEEGYIMYDRLKQLDFDHSRVLINTLATFHALSVAAAKVHPELVAEVGKEHIFFTGNQNTEMFRLYLQSFSAFSKVIKKWEGFERFEYISEDKKEKAINKLTEIFTPTKRFNVLNHGDLWTNNMLFKYNEDGAVTDAKLVDFQICKFASPGVDLNYFFWSSIQVDVLDNRIEELKAIYLDTLNRKLEEFGSDERLTKEQLEEELEFASFVGFFMVFVMLPFILADPKDGVHTQVEEMMDNSEALISTYDGIYYKSFVKKIIPKLETSIVSVFGNN